MPNPKAMSHITTGTQRKNERNTVQLPCLREKDSFISGSFIFQILMTEILNSDCNERDSLSRNECQTNEWMSGTKSQRRESGTSAGRTKDERREDELQFSRS